MWKICPINRYIYIKKLFFLLISKNSGRIIPPLSVKALIT